MLDEAERKTKRSVRAANLYKDEIVRLNPEKKLEKQKSDDHKEVETLDSVKKESEIERMRKEIADLQAKASKNNSKACTIS